LILREGATEAKRQAANFLDLRPAMDENAEALIGILSIERNA
jgi:hypothetical protein